MIKDKLEFTLLICVLHTKLGCGNLFSVFYYLYFRFTWYGPISLIRLYEIRYQSIMLLLVLDACHGNYFDF